MSEATSKRWPVLSKGQAFTIHFALSVLIFSSLVAVMYFMWFPGELFFLDGGWQGLKIVGLIDLVLGQALTLLLYKPGKPKLLMDMSFIALLQISALAYGFYATHQQRTIAVVYADRNFNTLSADAVSYANAELIEKEHTPRSISELKGMDNAYPSMLLTPDPAPEEFGKFVSQLLGGFPEYHERTDLIEPLRPEHKDLLAKQAVSVEKLQKTGADKIVATAMQKHGFKDDDVIFHHFKARYAKGIVIVSKDNQEILDYVPIKWNELIETKAAELDAETAEESGEAKESDNNLIVESSDEVESEKNQMAESIEQ